MKNQLPYDTLVEVVAFKEGVEIKSEIMAYGRYLEIRKKPNGYNIIAYQLGFRNKNKEK